MVALAHLRTQKYDDNTTPLTIEMIDFDTGATRTVARLDQDLDVHELAVRADGLVTWRERDCCRAQERVVLRDAAGTVVLEQATRALSAPRFGKLTVAWRGDRTTRTVDVSTLAPATVVSAPSPCLPEAGAFVRFVGPSGVASMRLGRAQGLYEPRYDRWRACARVTRPQPSAS